MDRIKIMINIPAKAYLLVSAAINIRYLSSIFSFEKQYGVLLNVLKLYCYVCASLICSLCTNSAIIVNNLCFDTVLLLKSGLRLMS